MALPFLARRVPEADSAAVMMAWIGICLAALYQAGQVHHGLTALTLCALLLLMRSRPRLPLSGDRSVFFLMVAFGVLLAVRTVTSEQPHVAFAIGAHMIMFPISYFVARSTRAPKLSSFFWWYIAPLLVLFSAWAFADKLSGQHVNGPFSDSNNLAAVLAVLAILAVCSAIVCRRLRAPTVCLLPIALIALYETESRGTFLALLLFALALVLFRALRLSGSPSSPKWRKAVIILATSAFVAVVSSGVAYVVKKVESGEPSLRARVALLQTAVDIGMEHGRWFGGGVGTFTRHYPEKRSIDDGFSAGRRAHNDYAELFADGGLLLAGSYLLLACSIFRGLAMAWKLGPSARAVFLAGSGYLVLFGAFNHTIVNMFIAVTGGALAGWGTQRGASAAVVGLSQVSSSRVVEGVLLVILAMFIPVLLFLSAAELYVKAALSGPNSIISYPFQNERILRLFAHTGLTPRAAFAYGFQAERRLSSLSKQDANRAIVARAAYDHYVLAYEQDPQNSNYAYQIARFLRYSDELKHEPASAKQTEYWFRAAIRLDKANVLPVLAYSRWLASRGEHDKALAQLEDSAQRIRTPSRLQPLLDEASRISELKSQRALASHGY